MTNEAKLFAHVQAKMIAKCPNLYVVETIGSQKVADIMDKSISQEGKEQLQVC